MPAVTDTAFAAPSASAVPARAAHAVRLQFFVSGALFATWGVHVPSVKRHFALGEQALAFAILAGGVGALLALAQAGRVVGRFGTRAVACGTGLVYALAIAALLAFDGYVALLALMLVFGVAASWFDVAINAAASDLEARSGRPLMSGFHALFSLGGMTGAALGGAALHAGMAAETHLGLAAVAGVALVLAGARAMLPPAGPPEPAAPLSLPRGALLPLGVLAALGLVAEGAMYDWSVLYLEQEIGAPRLVAAAGYAAFSAAMAAARFAGDAVRARVAPVPLLRASGALGALGMALALLVPHPAAVLAGFTLVGLGFANVVPVLFSAAARVPGVTPAHGIAAVSGLGYLGMMAGPPVVGLIAEGTSLGWGLATVVLFALALALAARRALPGG